MSQSNQDELSPEQLHEWYLEITAKLNPQASNKEARKPFRELTGEQQAIDKYIADEVNQWANDRVVEAQYEAMQYMTVLQAADYRTKIEASYKNHPYVNGKLKKSKTQAELHNFLNDPKTIEKAVKGSMDKRNQQLKEGNK